MHLMTIIPDMEFDSDKREPVIKHVCRVPPESDEVAKLIEGEDLFSRVNRWLTRKRILKNNQYYAKTCLKSTTAVNYEISSHLKNFPYMIHPFSHFRHIWNMFMSIFTFAVIITTPIFSTFYFDNTKRIIQYIMIIDFVFLIDIILSFFTGYYDQVLKKVTLDPRIVFKKYVTGYFIFDFLSAFPIEIFDFLIFGLKIHWYCTGFNFLKIFRIKNLFFYMHHLEKWYNISFSTCKLLKLIAIIIISLHWSACLVYYVPLVVQNFIEGNNVDGKSWILSDNMKLRDTVPKKYILCLNRATISLVNSDHYLNVKTEEDMITNLFLNVIGKIGFIYMLTQFLQLMSSFQSANNEHLRLMRQLQEYIQYKELPRAVQKRLRIYCHYWYKRNFNQSTRLLAQVSQPLRKELIFHNYRRLLESVEIFKYLPQSAIAKLIMYIEAEIYLLNDVIIKSGVTGDSMYFVDSGTVAVYTSVGKEICHLEDGSYFGEIALIMDNEQRTLNVLAIETCEILKVSRDAFLQIITPYPNLLTHLQKIAFDRLSKSLPMDEIANLHDLSPNYVNVSSIHEKRRN